MTIKEFIEDLEEATKCEGVYYLNDCGRIRFKVHGKNSHFCPITLVYFYKFSKVLTLGCYPQAAEELGISATLMSKIARIADRNSHNCSINEALQYMRSCLSMWES